MTASDEADLVARAQRGEASAVETLVRSVQDRLYQLSLRMLLSPEDARDATQEILLIGVTRLSTFRGESQFATWMYRIATSYLLRAKSRIRERDYSFAAFARDLGQPENPIAPAHLELAERAVLVREVFLGCTQAMLLCLDREHRLAFILSDMLGVDGTEAAHALGVTRAAFRKRLSRARERLDAFLSRHCGVADPRNACRCAHQVNLGVERRWIDLEQPMFTMRVNGGRPLPALEPVDTVGELAEIKKSLAIYRAHPAWQSPEDFGQKVRELIESGSYKSFA